MSTNNVTAIIDACVLCSPLKRNIIASLAEAGLFQVRWSDRIMGETERAITLILSKRDCDNPEQHAEDVRCLMNEAFVDATVDDYGDFGKTLRKLPDEGDRHVIAAAIKSKAGIIVTENLRDFPQRILSKHGIEARSSDTFIADAIKRNSSVATASIKQMLLRMNKHENASEVLFISMKKSGLRQSVYLLRSNDIL